MPLLPGWEEPLSRVEPEAIPSAATFGIPRDPAFYRGRTTYVATAAEAEAMAHLARQRPLAWIGFDTEYGYVRPGVIIDKDHTAYDPRSVRPLLLSLSMAEPEDRGGGTLANFVVDLRRPEVLDAVRAIFRLPIRFVGHFAQSELIACWQLGIEEPRMLWDSVVAERSLHLGRYHKGYRVQPAAEGTEKARIEEEIKREDRIRYTLVATCMRHGVDHPSQGDKGRLQRSFLAHPPGAPFSPEQVEYAAADAAAAALLYSPQVVAATRAGIAVHLESVEMPWVATNARMHWHGVRVDREKCSRVSEACARHLAELGPKLAAEGVANVRSHAQLKKYFGRKGLLHLFRKGRGYSFKKGALETFQGRDPAIALIRAARRVLDLQGERILTGEFEGADGRVHPQYSQLGAHTGRQTSRWPNVLGLGRIFRPLIVPAPGCGIGEVDLSQIEIGIAGAVYGDAQLVAMFNTGDVYSAMAQDFYRDRLGEEDRHLEGDAFKRKHREFRDSMKECTLGIIFGLTPHGLALNLGVQVFQAAALLERFLGMFPTLKRALAEAATFGAVRGYAQTASGLRRHRAKANGPPSQWERNWLTNHPVQGTAAFVFKLAGNRLDRLYRRYDARLLIALHDAYVYEAPLAVLGEVGSLTSRVMCESVEEFFPELRPKAVINNTHPHCWNKDGHTDSVDRWMEDPMYTLR